MTTPLSALTATWNNVATAFTAIKMTVTDTASAVGSKLMDLKVGATSMFQVGKNGVVAVGLDAPLDPGYHALLEVSETYTDPANFGATVDVNLSYEPTADVTASATALSSYINIPNTVAHDLGFGPSAVQGTIDIRYTGTTDHAFGFYGQLSSYSGTTSNLFGFYSTFFHFGGIVTSAFHFWGKDLTGVATNAYYYWGDGPGVTRIKEEGAVKGGVYAWYNPNFTKYTPGAANFERGVLQWNTGDIIEIGAEAAGTGTLRKVKILSADGLTTTSKSMGTATTTFAALPASPVVGDRAFITDCNTTTFAAAAAGGGANKVPVYYDGAWKVG